MLNEYEDEDSMSEKEEKYSHDDGFPLNLEKMRKVIEQKLNFEHQSKEEEGKDLDKDKDENEMY